MNEKNTGKKKEFVKLAFIAGAIVLIVFAMKRFGVFQYISLENIAKIKDWILGFGLLGPFIYVLLWIAACVFFLPGLPVALVGGIAFGPYLGTLYSSIGSTLGATAAFLIGRYAARGMVEGWVHKNSQLRKIDEGVKKQGWRMLMITRLVPLFPFNVQNYVYGLTDIPLLTYVFVSWSCMIPGTLAFSFAGGSLSSEIGRAHV